MRNSNLAFMGVFFALVACSKASHEPAQHHDEPLPYRSATATEIFDLRSKCAKLGEVLLDEDLVGPALNKDAVSHYNAKTNRCYVEVTVTSVDDPATYSADYLYDGQTKEMLAYTRTKNGKKSFMNFAMLPSGDQPGDGIPEEERVMDAIRLAMDDDRKS